MSLLRLLAHPVQPALQSRDACPVQLDTRLNLIRYSPQWSQGQYSLCPQSERVSFLRESQELSQPLVVLTANHALALGLLYFIGRDPAEAPAARGLRLARCRPIGAAALASRVIGPLAQPITRLDPTTA